MVTVAPGSEFPSESDTIPRMLPVVVASAIAQANVVMRMRIRESIGQNLPFMDSFHPATLARSFLNYSKSTRRTILRITYYVLLFTFYFLRFILRVICPKIVG